MSIFEVGIRLKLADWVSVFNDGDVVGFSHLRIHHG